MFKKNPRSETELYKEIFVLVRHQLELFEQAREKWPTMRMKARGARAEVKIDEMLRKVLILKLDGGCPEKDVIKRLVEDLEFFEQDGKEWREFDTSQKEYLQSMLVKMFG